MTTSLVRLLPGRDLRRAALLTTIGSLLEAGLTPAVAFEQEGVRKLAGTGATMAAASLRAGGSLAAAFACLDFEPRWLARVEAAEHSGHIGASLRRMAGELERSQEWKSAAIAKLAYPVFIVHFAALARGIVANAGGESGMAAFLWFALPVDLVLLGFAILVIGALNGGAAGDMLSRVGGIRELLRDRWLAPFLWSLADLHSTGVPLDKSLQMASRGSAPFFATSMHVAALGVSRGSNLTNELSKSGVVDPTCLALLGPAELTGTLGDALPRAAAMVDERLQRSFFVAARLPGILLYIYAVLSVAIVLYRFYASRLAMPNY